MKKSLILVFIISLCWAESLPIAGVTKLSGWFYEVRGYGREHQALDISANQYTPIHATCAGTVISATSNIHLGNYVDIQHKPNSFYRYAHCQKLLVKVGQRVTENSVIALVGNTGIQIDGKKIGSHLHLECRENGRKVFFTDRFVLNGKRVHWTLTTKTGGNDVHTQEGKEQKKAQ